MDQATLKANHLKRLGALKVDRSTWESHWRDIVRQIRPRSSKWYNELSNDGRRKNQSIINAKPTLAARTLVAGLMSGLTSPSRPWFRLATVDSRLSEHDSVKTWLFQVEAEIRETLLKSNIYGALHQVYWDLILIGTAVLHLEDDAETHVRGYVFPSGSYCLAQNDKLEVDTLYRETRMTVRQLVRKFGLEACSQQVQAKFKNREFEVWVDVVHAITPNEDFREGKIGPAGKRFLSAWFEATGDATKALRVSGYDEQPFLGPRWEQTGEDTYGNSPAMDALGDCRALQSLEKKKGQVVAYICNPPMKGPGSLANKPLGLLPGETTFFDGAAPGATFEPAYTIHPSALPAIAAEIREHEHRIDQTFYADLWLMLAQSDGNMTAREVIERREEKLLQLGPVVESLHTQLLKPMFARIIGVLFRKGLLPPAPDELRGQELKIEYTSIMAQAQKLLGKTGIDSLFTFVANAAQLKPDVLDKLDVDQIVDEYATILGVPPVVVRPDDDVEAMRTKRAQAQQQQAQLAQAQQAATTAKDLSGASLENSNALSEMLRGVGAR